MKERRENWQGGRTLGKYLRDVNSRVETMNWRR